MHKSRTAKLAVSLVAALGAVLFVAAPAQAAVGDTYVALGDSYSSGVGAGSYIGSSGSCLRSTNAYSALWAVANAPTSYVSVACSGATTSDVLNSQLSALSSGTSLASITIGGNDVGFSNIMTTCILYGTTQCVAAVQAAENYAQTTLPGSLNNLFNAIRASAPNARVVVLDYPVFYQLNTFCIGLSGTSHAKIDEGINILDGVIYNATITHANFRWADVRSSFVGHQLCSGSAWLHSLSLTNFTESYHPTASGQSGGYYPVFQAVAG